MVPRSGADMLTHCTASPSEPCGAATAVTTGEGLTVATVARRVEWFCVRKTGNSSDGGAPAVRSAAPATTRRVGRIRQYYVGSERAFGIRTRSRAAAGRSTLPVMAVIFALAHRRFPTLPSPPNRWNG